MKDIVCVCDKNEKYVKRLTSLAIKKYGKDYIFLSFVSFSTLKEYTESNKVRAVMYESENLNESNSIKAEKKFILVDNKKEEELNGEINYVYKYQNAENILKILNKVLSIKTENVKEGSTKIITFYSPYQTRNVKDKMLKICRHLLKSKKILVVDLDEFSSFKAEKGLSNIIYKYKESGLDTDYIRNQICLDGNIEKISSVKFPEDFLVITNYELCSIISNLKIINYDYIFVLCDTSFIKNQYIFTDSDKIIIFDNTTKDNSKVDILLKYIEEQNMINVKKIFHYTKEKEDSKNFDDLLKDIFKGA